MRPASSYFVCYIFKTTASLQIMILWLQKLLTVSSYPSGHSRGSLLCSDAWVSWYAKLHVPVSPLHLFCVHSLHMELWIKLTPTPFPLTKQSQFPEHTRPLFAFLFTETLVFVKYSQKPLNSRFNSYAWEVDHWTYWSSHGGQCETLQPWPIGLWWMGEA